jgi:cell division protein FtsW
MRSNSHVDNVLLFLVIGLCLFGLVMITSIGVPKSIQLSAPGVLYPNCSDAGVDCYFLFKRHLSRLIVGLVAMWIVAKIPFRVWKKLATPFLGLMMILLISVLVFGNTHNTFARSWFTIFNTSIQPTEFTKLGLILYFAHWMEKKSSEIHTFHYGFIPFCIVLLITTIPVVLQPDFGATLVIASICAAIYFVGGARIRHLVLGATVAFVMAALLVMNVEHVSKRFQFFMNSDDCRQDYCWQSFQANIAVGSGGVWGKGITQGVQKSYWLPQATDDFIFAASAEELGFFRTALLVLIYAYFAYRGFKIAAYAPNKFSRLVAVGITSWISVQAFINMAVNVSIFPITGITLPFVSYGGSSMLATLIAVGILLNISKYTPEYAYSSNRGRNRRPHNPQLRHYRSI